MLHYAILFYASDASHAGYAILAILAMLAYAMRATQATLCYATRNATHHVMGHGHPTGTNNHCDGSRTQ